MDKSSLIEKETIASWQDNYIFFKKKKNKKIVLEKNAVYKKILNSKWILVYKKIVFPNLDLLIFCFMHLLFSVT